MNRPFSAFGTLAAMLALAMFAVSSTSRSTTVRPRPSGRVGANPLAQRRPSKEHAGQTVVSRGGRAGSESPVCSSPSECPTTIARATAPACGFLACTAQNVTDCETAAKSALVPVRVEFAELVGSLPQNVTSTEWPSDAVSSAASSDDSHTDLTALFKEVLTSAHRPADGRRPATLHSGSRRTSQQQRRRDTLGLIRSALDLLTESHIWKEVRFLATGVLTRGTSELARAAWVFGENGQSSKIRQPLSWSEYADLIDRVSTRMNVSSLPLSTSEHRASVRSSRGLLHSAAAAVIEVGMLLQRAGAGIDRLDGERVFETVSQSE